MVKNASRQVHVRERKDSKTGNRIIAMIYAMRGIGMIIRTLELILITFCGEYFEIFHVERGKAISPDVVSPIINITI